jgi:putative FmdB family regulatory protein
VPIYDYTCVSCRHLVEVIHGMTESGPRFCPNCGLEGTMRKGFSTPAVHFKGSGWAKKDRGAAARSAAGTSKSSGDEGASTSSTAASTSTGDSPDRKATDGSGSTSKTSGAADKPAGEAKPASKAVS